VRRIAVANQKGGSAKTTTTIHVGAGLAQAGRRVLLVDMDPQGHLAEGFGITAGELDHEMSEVLDGKVALPTIIRGVRPGLDLAPSNIRLSYLEAVLFTKLQRESRLKRALEAVRNRYDVVLIDCPPSLGILTINALAAADAVLVPMACEFYAMLGVSLLLQTIEEMRAEINPDLRILGVAPTKCTRTVHAREVLERTRAELVGAVKVYDHVVPESVRFREAAALGKTIYEHAPESRGAAAYLKLAEEVAAGG
jgi:chromosome partitioning protein